MNTTTTCLPPAPLPLHRPWLRRVLADLGARWQRPPVPATEFVAPVVPVDYGDLAHLDEDTLRDIGAPDWVHEADRCAPLWQLERMRW